MLHYPNDFHGITHYFLIIDPLNMLWGQHSWTVPPTETHLYLVSDFMVSKFVISKLTIIIKMPEIATKYILYVMNERTQHTCVHHVINYRSDHKDGFCYSYTMH